MRSVHEANWARQEHYSEMLKGLSYLVLGHATYRRCAGYDQVVFTFYEKKDGEICEYLLEIWAEFGDDRRVGLVVNDRILARPR